MVNSIFPSRNVLTIDRHLGNPWYTLVVLDFLLSNDAFQFLIFYNDKPLGYAIPY